MATRKRKARQASPPLQEDKHFTVVAGKSSNTMEFIRRQPIWIVLAIASGSCAAINGVFAKLTTTALTSTLASALASFLGLAEDNTYINIALRGTFFGLNIVFNIAMWALFTAALTRGSSTTRVSIINVSSNFFITAILGAMIFGEKLPLLWWCGAGLLAAGNVVIGRREEGEKPGGTTGLEQTPREAEEAEGLLTQTSQEDLLELRESLDNHRVKKEGRLSNNEEADNPI